MEWTSEITWVWLGLSLYWLIVATLLFAGWVTAMPYVQFQNRLEPSTDNSPVGLSYVRSFPLFRRKIPTHESSSNDEEAPSLPFVWQLCN